MDKPVVLGGKPLFSKPVPFTRPTLPSYEELEPHLRDILETGMLTKGKYLRQYEEMLREYLSVPHAIGVVNATMGLFMLLKAFDLKGEVIVPSFSFMATFHVVEVLGLKPIFVDCEKDTFTIDINSVKKAISPNTCAILGVNIFGNPPDLDGLERIAKEHNIRFFMDSAHSFGTLYKGKKMGRYGDGEVFSTSATKLLATGEGGVVTTKYEDVANFVKIYKEYGNTGDYDPIYPGINGRMSEFHALLGVKILPKVEEFAIKRNKIAQIYKENLSKVSGISFQRIRKGCRSSYKDFCILVDPSAFGLNRDQLMEALRMEGISTRRYFYPPGHMQRCYKKYAYMYKDSLYNTEFISNRSLCLPICSHMEYEDVHKISLAIERIQRYHREIKKRHIDLAGYYV